MPCLQATLLSLLNSPRHGAVSEHRFAINTSIADCPGPCKMIAPLVEKLDEQYKNIKFAEVDVDQSQPIARKYEVSSMYVETTIICLHALFFFF
jgi:thiol-disulfide isomerase/thioredoxin